MARDIFISYSQPDYDCAHELVARLESQGIECWIAPRDISPAADWAAEIIDAISAARAMILVFSASSNDSPQVRREVERAVHKKLRILPFRIQDVTPSKSLEYFLSSQHWMDAFPPPREPHYARLGAYLNTMLGGAPAAQPVVSGRAAVSVNADVFTAPVLLKIETKLASYIGPVAKLLVKRAASRTSSLEELVTQLAAELESQADQREFTRLCRQIRSTEV